MIIDMHVHITEVREPVWGWSPFTVADLLEVMDTPVPVRGRMRTCEVAVAMTALGKTALWGPDFRAQHQYLIDAVRKYPNRIIGNFCLNPRQGVQPGIDELRRLVREDNFRMVKLHPTIHNFWPKSPELSYPVIEEAIRLGIPVLFHMGEPPYSVPALLEPVAKDFPKATIIIAHLGSQKICYADDAVNVARHCENVFLETGWGMQPRLIEAAKALGASRLVFGSDCPPLELWSQIRPLEVLCWKPPLGVGLSEDDLEKILGDNIAEMIGLRHLAPTSAAS